MKNFSYEISIERSELEMLLPLLVSECNSSKYEDLETHLNYKLYGCRASFSAFHLTLKFIDLNNLTESMIVIRKMLEIN